ncbi:hepatic leukemia factor isoform X2 [Aquila chrysaetos chrysaetos]|nr:hepatic leukemia factor isoform X2 [Aquila chrysaetos chrysaetos]
MGARPGRAAQSGRRERRGRRRSCAAEGPLPLPCSGGLQAPLASGARLGSAPFSPPFVSGAAARGKGRNRCRAAAPEGKPTMSRPLPLNPTFLPPTYGVLKSLLENPLKLPLAHEDAFGKEKDKEKKLDDDSTSTTVPQSAFLGPTLWDKTLPYDGDTFQLEYMDLEEFLSENGIPPSPNQHEHSPHQSGLQQATSASPSVMDLSSRASTSVHPGMVSQNCMQSPVRPGQILPANRNTPSPIDPETIQVPVGYEPDPADLALSSIPGQEMFDPRKRKFSEEELKPQPMIKKARKVFIPDDLKDDKYWARRRKNNMAAKRSRDARRLKENQIAIRASFLEKENSALRQEVADLRKELGKCKNVLAKYEARHGPL